MTDKELLKRTRGMSPEELEDMLFEEFEDSDEPLEPFDIIGSMIPEKREKVKKLIEEGKIDELGTLL